MWRWRTSICKSSRVRRSSSSSSASLLLLYRVASSCDPQRLYPQQQQQQQQQPALQQSGFSTRNHLYQRLSAPVVWRSASVRCLTTRTTPANEDEAATVTTTTEATTTTTSVWQTRLDALEQESRKSLLQPGESRERLEELIQQWSVLLDELLPHHTPPSTITTTATTTTTEHEAEDPATTAVERLYDVYQAWKSTTTTSGATPTTTQAPYVALIKAFAHTGPRALSVLQDWEVALAGDIELAPREEHYQAVLAAYAAMPNDTPEAADVAMEIAEHLEQSWSSQDDWPNLHTYQHVVKCLSRAMRHAVEIDDPEERIPKLFESLEASMDKFLQLLRTKMTDDQFFAMALTLSDALQGWNTMQKFQQKQHPYLPEGGGVDLNSTSLVRRKEWCMQWGRLVQEGNADLWIRVKENGKYTGLTVLEQTTMAILRMHHRDLLAAVLSTSSETTTTPESCVVSVEGMTKHVLQLDDMMSKSTNATAPWTFLPSPRHYQRTIQACVHLRKHGPPEYAVLAQQQQEYLLNRMQEQHTRNHSNPQTSLEHEQATNSWNEVLKAYLDAGLPERVKELWDKNNEKSADGTRRVRKNQNSFTILLQSLAAKREPDTPIQASHRALQAHSILHKLASHDPATRIFEPTPQHFDSVMVAWSRSHHPNAAQYCQQVFERLVELADQANSRGYERVGASDTWMKPTSFHYNTLITTWGLSRSPGGFQNVLTLFQRMKQSGVKLELSSYTAVLFALSRSQSVESAQMADTILTEMEKKSRHPEEGDQSGTEPTVNCYNSLLYAWCHSGAKDAHTRCEVAFRRLMAAYEESGWNPALRPDSTSYVTLIDSFVNKQSLSDEAGAVPAAVRAEEILNQMEALAAEGLSDPPDAKVYTTVMKAHWKSGQSDAALKVEEIVKRMKIAYEAGNTAAKPDVQAMTVLIRTWAKSDAPDKAKIAWEIHKEMRDAFENGDTDMQPNSYSLSAVLNACAFTNTRDQRIRSEAVKVALMAMNELDNGVNEGLNEHSFQNMFQVLVSQIDDLKERTRFASVIFQQCCQAGYVSRWTLLSLKKHVPALYRKLPASPDKALNLPEHWTRHVAKADRHDAFS